MAPIQPLSESSLAFVLKKLVKIRNNLHKDQILKTIDKPVNWTCEICQVPLKSLKTAVQHYNEREHLYKLQLSKNAFFAECTVCKSVFLTEWHHQKHFESDKHAENVLESINVTSPTSDECRNEEGRNALFKTTLTGKKTSDGEENNHDVGIKKEFHIALAFDGDGVNLRNGRVLENPQLFAVGDVIKSNQEETDAWSNDLVMELPKFLFASDQDDGINESKYAKKRRWDKAEIVFGDEE